MQFNANKLQAGGGSGLGLYITKGIVVQHTRGKIWAESAGEGHGCTFFVQLPTVVLDAGVAAAQLEDAERLPRGASISSLASPRIKSIRNAEYAVQQAAALQRAVEQGDGPAAGAEPLAGISEEVFNPLILVVDDSPLNRRMLCRMLEQEGFDTMQVGLPHANTVLALLLTLFLRCVCSSRRRATASRPCRPSRASR